LQLLVPFDALSCPPMGGGGNFCREGRVESMK
jgi:hypothetical protein